MIAKIYPHLTPQPDLNGELRGVRYFDIRKLTELECFRLMDVDEADARIMCDSPFLSKSARYKLAGNSIVVNCLYLIFEQIYCPEVDPTKQPSLFADEEPTWRVPLPDTIRLVTLCSGYDSQALAMRRFCNNHRGVSFDLSAWSEFDPESKRPLNEQPAVIAHNLLFPQWADRNLGDMTAINWGEWRKEHPEEIDILTYSTPCFVAGTLITTDRGLTAIEDISIIQHAHTHTGKWQEIITPMRRHYRGKMVSIRAMMMDKTVCTANHPFYVRKMTRVGHAWKRTFLAPEWVHAEDLDKTCYLGMPVNGNSTLPKWDGVSLHQWGHDRESNTLSPMFEKEEFWYVMGRYIGDGWRRDDANHKAIIIACSSRNESALLRMLNAIGFRYTKTAERTCTRYTIYGKELCEFVKRYGYRAHGKRIDAETLNLPDYLLRAFMNGYIDSDGCSTKEGFRITTVSRELAYGIVQAVAKAYHRPSRMTYSQRPKTSVIEGRLVHQRDTYSVTWKMYKGKQDKAFYEDGVIWYPIREITTYEGECEVYNMEVEEDHSYIANNAIVHNCQSISQAGKREGIKKGSGTRSAVLWSTEDAIRALRPKFLLQENVRALCNKVNMPDFEEWQKVCNDCGYDNYWTIMNAKNYGIPQNRERVFMLSVRRDLNLPAYTFPRPFPLEGEVADVLEQDADESYYLNPTNVIKFLQANQEESDKGIIYLQTDHKYTDEELAEIRSNAVRHAGEAD